MAWIESHQSLRNHPKTKKAARLLGITCKELIGSLHFLWWWALDYAQDGDLTEYETEEIEDAADWEGERGKFLTVLLTCGTRNSPGFLEHTGDGRLMIHDWWDYAGKLVERREKDRNRKRSTMPTSGTSNGIPQEVQRNSDGNREESVTIPCVPNQPTNHTYIGAAEAGANAPNPGEKDTSPLTAIGQPFGEEKTNGIQTKPNSQKQVKLSTEQQELFGAICKSVGWDSRVIGEEYRNAIGQTVKAFTRAGYTPDDLRAFDVWWTSTDWRGRQGQYPTLKQLRAEIAKVKQMAEQAEIPTRVY
jgi:hypothetical protein